MAEIDYFAIETDLADTLRDDSQQRLATAHIVVEDANPIGDATPYVGVFLSSRQVTEVRLSSPTPYEVRLQLEVWVWEISPRDFSDACRKRDLTLRKVEQVLRDNRKFSDAIQTSTVNGGEFETARDGGGFWAGGSVVVEALVTA